jgi:hypothetical protein
MMKITAPHDNCYAMRAGGCRNFNMTTSIEKSELKKKMLAACIAKQQSLIYDFRERIKSLTEAQGLGNEESYDAGELSLQSSRVSEINTLNQLLEFANQELELLENLKITQDLIHDRAVLGAVVVTGNKTFYISASIENFTVDGQPYFGISAHSPLFEAMSGKRKGDSFSFKGRHYEITDIF